MEDDLLLDAGPSAAVGLRPANTGPAPFGQAPLPGLALLGEHMLVAGPTPKANGRELAFQVVGQPVGDLFAKALVFSAETQSHDASPSSSSLARRSLCHDASPNSTSEALARLK